jgi:5-methylcytosine-specific restriction endonuclease McrA
MAKKPSRKTIVKKLDTVFSQFIRRRFAVNEIAECVTCGTKSHYKKLQAGHFMSRKHYSTRWNDTNVQVQCYSCNVMRYGEQYKYGLYLEQVYGKGTAEQLQQKSREITKFSDNQLIDMINYYNELLTNLK